MLRKVSLQDLTFSFFLCVFVVKILNRLYRKRLERYYNSHHSHLFEHEIAIWDRLLSIYFLFARLCFFASLR